MHYGQKKINIVAASFVLALVCGMFAGCEPKRRIEPEDEYRPAQPTHFTLGIEQGGKRIEMQGNQVTIDKKPFRIVFFFDRMGPMLVQASFKPTMVQKAVDGVPLDRLLKPNSSVAEELKNPMGNLYIHDDGRYHNWLYLGPNIHRFDASDGVTKVDGGYICRRTVRNFVEGNFEVPVEESDHDSLYLLFVKTERSGSAKRVELQRDWLKVNFRD